MNKIKTQKTIILISVVVVLIVINILLSGYFKTKEDIVAQPTQQKTIQPKIISEDANLRKVDLAVEGMVCPVCARSIKSSLLEEEGILAVLLTFEKGIAEVYYDANKISVDSIVNAPVFSGFYSAKIIGESKTTKERVLSLIEETSEVDDPKYLAAVGKLSVSNDLVDLMKTADQESLKKLVDEYLATMDSLVIATNNIENEKAQFKFKEDVVLTTSSQINKLSDSLPGDTTYDAKRKAEEIRINLSYNLVIKAKSQFLAAINRINEADMLYKSGKNVDNLIKEYKQNLEATLSTIKNIISKGEKENGRLLEFVIADKKFVLLNLPEHKTILLNMYGEIPNEIAKTVSELENISAKENNIVQFEKNDIENITTFLNWIKERGWYAHTIVDIHPEEKLLTIRDGKGNIFNITFEFAELHLREHHPLDSYVDEMGIEGFLSFAKEKGLFQHEIKDVLPESEEVVIIGDKNTEFETEFTLDFSTILSHMKYDHRWTNKDLLNAGYCEDNYPKNVEKCKAWLTEYEKT